MFAEDAGEWEAESGCHVLLCDLSVEVRLIEYGADSLTSFPSVLGIWSHDRSAHVGARHDRLRLLDAFVVAVEAHDDWTRRQSGADVVLCRNYRPSVSR